MPESHAQLLTSLVQLSKIDTKLLQILAERKKLENSLAEKAALIKKLQAEKVQKTKFHTEKQTLYNKEEKRIKEERESLVARRKALHTLNNYKLQQAAEREIDTSSKMLDQHEDLLFKMLEDVEKVSSELNVVNQSLDKIAQDLLALEKEATLTIANLEERQKTALEEKEQVLKLIDSASLNMYQRMNERFPGKAVLPLINKDNCSGCFMPLGPQVVGQILKGDAVIKCRGCGRIVYIDESTTPKEK